MRSALAWVLLPLYFGLTLLTLCSWDIILKCLWPLNRRVHKMVLDLGIHLLLIHLRVVGTSISVRHHGELPTDRPLIVISNHQSVFDIPLLMWYLRRHHPVFVAKQELGKWVPSVSHTLRNNGSVLINRKDAGQAIPAIRKLGALIEERAFAACIFPEGTRARDGVLKKFRPSGVANLLEHAPSALLVPVAISGSWKLVRHNFLPVPFGVHVTMDVLPPIDRENASPQALCERAEALIRGFVERAEAEAGQGKKGRQAAEPTGT